MTPSPVKVAITLLADPAASWRHELSHTSLMHGWLPATAQLVTVAVLIPAVGWRTRRWRRRWFPIAGLSGAALGWWAHWYVGSAGLSGEVAPDGLWTWIAIGGAVLVTSVAGWRTSRWGRRLLSVVAIPLVLLCTMLSLNLWVGYFPTLQTAWGQFTDAPLPDQTDRATVSAMQLAGTVPAKGVVVGVDIGSAASGFVHRGEFVYLPPAWFATNPPPRLPVVMMVGAEFNTPSDWLRAGSAIDTIDAFATAHGGAAPVFVFVDSDGVFDDDTECVDGPRGDAADHLTKDVVPFLESTFGVNPRPSSWGVVGFSSGGTCAVDLTVMHPDLFASFVDIAGDAGPNAGNRVQTIARLFGGDASRWAAFDPSTVISKHATYVGVSGLFITAAARPDDHGRVAPAGPEGAAASSLCRLGATRGIGCSVVAQPGGHDWAFGGRAFASALPWLAGQVDTPGVPRIPLPNVAPSATVSRLASARIAAR